MMTYEQKAEHGAAFAPRYATIARELSSQTGTAWEMSRPYDHGARFTRAVDGLSVYVNANWTGKASLHASADIPRDADGVIPYVPKDDQIASITIGTAKTDAQIARDLVRRLVTPFEPLYAQLTARNAATLAEYGKARANAERVATAIGAEVWTRNGRTQDTQHGLIRVNRQHVHDLTVHANGTVEIKISLPIDAAIALINAQPRRADGE